MQRPIVLLLLVGLAVTGCSDYQLHSIRSEPAEPDRPPFEPAPPDRPPVDPPEVPQPWTPPDDSPSPWDNLDPGSLPDLVFVAPWSRSNTVMDFEEPDPQDNVSSLDWSLVAFDLLGQVLVELDVPGSESRRTNPKAVDAAGPGRILLTIQWLDENTEETGWEAWLVDAVTQEMELVATWTDTGGTLWLPQAERTVEIGTGPLNIHLGMWPTEPDSLAIWAEDVGNWGDELPLRIVHISDPQVDDVFHVPYLDAPWASMAGPSLPWDMDLSTLDDGQPIVLAGTRIANQHDSTLDSWMLTAWSPEDGPLWKLDVDYPGLKREAAFARGVSDPAAVSFGDQSTWGTDFSPLVLWEADAANVAGVSESAQGWKRVGPVIDPLAPVVTMVSMTSAGGWRDQFDFFHQGQRVWRIEALRFGLVQEEGFFGQIALLELPAQEP